MRAAFFAVLATACAGSTEAPDNMHAHRVASVAAASAPAEAGVTTVAASSSSGTIVLRTITVEVAGGAIGVPESDRELAGDG